MRSYGRMHHDTSSYTDGHVMRDLLLTYTWILNYTYQMLFTYDYSLINYHLIISDYLVASFGALLALPLRKPRWRFLAQSWPTGAFTASRISIVCEIWNALKWLNITKPSVSFYLQTEFPNLKCPIWIKTPHFQTQNNTKNAKRWNHKENRRNHRITRVDVIDVSWCLDKLKNPFGFGSFGPFQR